MSVRYTIHREPHPWVYLEMDGVVTAREIINGMASIPEEPGFVKGMDGLSDLTKLKDFKGGALEVAELANFYAEMQSRADWERWAIVAPQAHIYGLVLMWQTYANVRYRGSVKAFRDLRGAEEWLKVKSEAEEKSGSGAGSDG